MDSSGPPMAFSSTSRRRRRCNDAAASNNTEDFISQLSDDILISIIARVPTNEAVRTSILSNRWRNLYKFVPDIELHCECFDGGSRCPHDPNMFFDEVCRFLSLRSGFKIYDLSLHCCYTKSNASRFEQFIVSLGRLGIESLGLRPWIRAFYSDPFSFSCHLISQMPTLKLLSLVRCSLASLKLTQSNNSLLQVLSLTRVTVADGALECILSNCLSLHSLEFSDCALPSKLFIRGSNLQLKTFCIIGCWDMEEIEFYASNLVTFEFKSPEVANFLFDHVPKLQNIFLDLKYENTMSYVCAKLVKDMPHLKYLIFSTEGDIYQVCSRTMRINTFSNLRQLSLRLYAISSPDRVDLLLMTSFLEKCPLLQEFHLDCDFLKCDDGQKAKRPVAVIHSELKKVEISGHSGTKNEMEFALYILKSAICLEQMHISRCSRWYHGYGRWMGQYKRPWTKQTLKMIHKHLQSQAISKKARLTIQNSPFLY